MIQSCGMCKHIHLLSERNTPFGYCSKNPDPGASVLADDGTDCAMFSCSSKEELFQVQLEWDRMADFIAAEYGQDTLDRIITGRSQWRGDCLGCPHAGKDVGCQREDCWNT